MMSTRQIIQPMSDFERARQAARLAAVAKAQHDAKGIIEALERAFGPTLAYPMTRHALMLLDAADAVALRSAGREAR